MEAITYPLAKTVYDYLVRFKRENDGCSPSYEQIMLAVDISSKSMVHYALASLEKSGHIYYGSVSSTYRKTNICLTGGQWLPPPALEKGE